ncbi:MAG: flagellar basal body-associated FliL family protein [Pseudomonadota bacterium]
MLHPVLTPRLAAMRGMLLALFLGTAVPVAVAEEAEDADPEQLAPPRLVYYEMRPTFITNFGPVDTPRLMYLKADVSLRVPGGSGQLAADTHLPALRNELVLLLSRLDEDAVVTSEGREDVRLEAKAALNRVLQREEGEPLIEDLLFTNFIVQR